MRGEGVITQQRAGRGAAKAPAARRGAAAQRPSARKTRPAGAGGDAWTWRRAMAFVPLALKLLLAVAFGILVFVGYQRAASASFFRVASVDVSGERRASRREIEATVAAAARDGVWRADLEEISRRVRRLPWVHTAVVTRVLPDQLRVRVTEREPRVVSRTDGGRFVWVDEDGLALGPASADGEDFTVRGLQEAEGPTAENRKRVALALELKREWERAGLAGRVSEVNLTDLHDVRVYLTGADSGVHIQILGSGDHARLFGEAVRILEERRQTPLGRYVTYILMRPGKDPTFGYLNEAVAKQAQAEEAAAAAARGEAPPSRPAAVEAPRPAAPRARPAAEAKPKRDERERPRDAGSRPNGEATRPRRAG